jgi:hypothetical protein
VTKRHDSASASRAGGGRTVASASQAVAQGICVDEVRECGVTVDLDDRKPRPVARLEAGVTGDVDELEVETELLPERGHDLDGALAEGAVLRVVDADGGYG